MSELLRHRLTQLWNSLTHRTLTHAHGVVVSRDLVVSVCRASRTTVMPRVCVARGRGLPACDVTVDPDVIRDRCRWGRVAPRKAGAAVRPRQRTRKRSACTKPVATSLYPRIRKWRACVAVRRRSSISLRGGPDNDPYALAVRVARTRAHTSRRARYASGERDPGRAASAKVEALW